MYAWLLEACGGGASWGGSLDFSQAWRQRGWILGEHARRSESRSAGTVQLWEIRGRYEWKRAPHSDPSAQGWVHGFNHQSLCSLAWWKQLAHYTFIETQPFITFLPWLCPNEAPEQGLNVMTLLRLFLKGENRMLMTQSRWVTGKAPCTPPWGWEPYRRPPAMLAAPSIRGGLCEWIPSESLFRYLFPDPSNAVSKLPVSEWLTSICWR